MIVEISSLRADDAAFDVSDPRDVAALFRAEDEHFWHRARARVVRDRLRALGLGRGARFLDVGCGAGSVAVGLRREGFDVTGVDGHRSLLEVAERRDPALTLWLHDLRRGTRELPAHDFDAAGLFDVIEHLDDPVGALREALACVKPGACVVGTVPALMMLWSGIDEHQGHRTRYSTRTLRAVLERVEGARVVEIAPFFRVLVPMLVVQRRIVGRRGDAVSAAQNLAIPPRPLNAALYALSLAEHRMARVLDATPLEGASIWFALRRER